MYRLWSLFIPVWLLVAYLAAPAWPQAGGSEIFGGPSILSRGQGPNFGSARALGSLRLAGGVQGIYDSGLTNVSVNEVGDIPSFASFGTEGYLSATGAKSWRKSLLSLEYRGNYRHYINNQYFDGSDHTLALAFQHQPSRHWVVTAREAAGTFSRGFFGASARGFFDPTFAQTPTTEFFDNRTHYLSSVLDATYIASSRLSYNLGADGFLVRRQSDALSDMTGYRARGDVSYRVGRYTTLSFGYMFNQWEYKRVFGSTNVHSPYINFSQQFGPHWEASVIVGGYRQESQGLNIVQLDPAIAQIIGRTQGIEAFYSVSWLPNISGRVSRSLRRGWLSFEGGQSVNAGNGLLLATRSKSANMSYSHSVNREIGLTFAAGHVRMLSLGLTASELTQSTASAGFNYALTRSWHLTTNAQFRHNDSIISAYRRNSTRLAFGVAYSPGDVPLTLWQ